MRKAAYFCIVITVAIAALIYGKSLLIPLISAFLLWFLTFEIRNSLNRISFFNKYLPNWLKNVVVFALMLFTLSAIAEILSSNISGLAASFQSYEANLQKVYNAIQDTFNINLEESVKSMTGDLDFGAMASRLVNGLSGFLGNTMMILVYALFIFLEETSFKDKIPKIFNSEAHFSRFKEISSQVEKSIFDYFRLKTLVSLMTGVLSYIALLIVGIDSPMFWAFLIFLLNFIPTIGSLIATVFPALFSLVQFGTWTPFLIILVAVGGVQLIVGNIIEPRIMGQSLNISPLVTIIALSVWGQLWGITGMVLSVPITVMMIIVFSKFESTKNLAILLTENGKVE